MAGGGHNRRSISATEEVTTMDSAVGPRLDDIINTAQRAAMAGRMDEAARAWEHVLARSPEHPLALFFLGQHALAGKDMKAARELLQRAALGAPKEPAIPLNLAFVFRATGEVQAEADALTRALVIDPYFYPALVAKAMLYERMGQRRSAAEIYVNVLKIAPPDDQLPAGMRSAIAHAREVVSENASQLQDYLRGRLGPIEERHGGDNLERFHECRDAVVGTKKTYVHEPTMLNFPRLPAIQFYERAQFPWLEGIEAQTDVIRDELQVLLREHSKDFAPYVNHAPGAPLNQWAELQQSKKWSALFLWKDGARVEQHCKICPKTVAALEALPLAHIPGYSPCGFFSALQPHTRIPPHTGVTNVRAIVHLPLILPGRCYFRVGNETREWKLGEALVFDDTIEHEAWNDSDQLRVVFIFDIWNPGLSQAERELVCELLSATRDYYGGPQADFSH